jgi:hypothetical protein
MLSDQLAKAQAAVEELREANRKGHAAAAAAMPTCTPKKKARACACDARARQVSHDWPRRCCVHAMPAVHAPVWVQQGRGARSLTWLSLQAWKPSPRPLGGAPTQFPVPALPAFPPSAAAAGPLRGRRVPPNRGGQEGAQGRAAGEGAGGGPPARREGRRPGTGRQPYIQQMELAARAVGGRGRVGGRVGGVGREPAAQPPFVACEAACATPGLAGRHAAASQTGCAPTPCPSAQSTASPPPPPACRRTRQVAKLTRQLGRLQEKLEAARRRLDELTRPQVAGASAAAASGVATVGVNEGAVLLQGSGQHTRDKMHGETMVCRGARRWSPIIWCSRMLALYLPAGGRVLALCQLLSPGPS